MLFKNSFGKFNSRLVKLLKDNSKFTIRSGTFIPDPGLVKFSKK